MYREESLARFERIAALLAVALGAFMGMLFVALLALHAAI
jgi:hypothetical protein